MGRPPARDETRVIPIAQIQRSICTPRIHHDEAALERLAHWIKRRGLLHPIVVRTIGRDRFEVVAGERRLLAAGRAGLAELECRVRIYDDHHKDDEPVGDVMALEDALIENLVREGLSKLEESEAILELVCLHIGETQAFVIERLGSMYGRAIRRGTPVNITLEDDQILEIFSALNLIGWQAFYTHRIPLLRLPEEIRGLCLERRISCTAAIRLARVEVHQRKALIEQIRSGQLRGAALNFELDCLLNSSPSLQFRWQQLRRALKKRLCDASVRDKLEALEQELGLS
jgi:ParB family transcriptional regulator, chromosome partitioning protein